MLKFTFLEAKRFMSDVIGTEHLLLSLLRDDENIAAQLLQQGFSVTYAAVRAELATIVSGNANPRSGPAQGGGRTPRTRRERQNMPQEKSKTPVLDNFGRDLTSLAEEDKLDPVVGREQEIERVAQVLSRRKKNNPVRIGEPGVGKTAIAEGIALRPSPWAVPRASHSAR